ncbi:hypothetical protein [Sulfitobacter sp. 20_GPM-1509m]|uniref:hypothetical protein n=1 Tax=Sulfitobacter sp. 20_GPM-1509m TaxID=1380367 RepID=UPI00049023D8|nr:hypothetical protein [Sulfitobacter sp. 20_GPM-1509m]
MTQEPNTTPEGVERLSPYAIDGGCDAYGSMEHDDHGDYVSYEDYCVLSARVAELDKALDAEIENRDGFEKAFSDAYELVTGNQMEWSSAYGVLEALADMKPAKTARNDALREVMKRCEGWFGTPGADDIARILHGEIEDLIEGDKTDG